MIGPTKDVLLCEVRNFAVHRYASRRNRKLVAALSEAGVVSVVHVLDVLHNTALRGGRWADELEHIRRLIAEVPQDARGEWEERLAEARGKPRKRALGLAAPGHSIGKLAAGEPLLRISPELVGFLERLDANCLPLMTNNFADDMPVRDQGEAPICVGMATTDVIQHSSRAWLPELLSAWLTYRAAKQFDGYEGPGTTIGAAGQGAFVIGTLTERESPTRPQMDDLAIADWERERAAHLRSVGWCNALLSRKHRRVQAKLLWALMAGHFPGLPPLECAVGIPLDEAFFLPSVQATGIAFLPDVDRIIGGHAVVACDRIDAHSPANPFPGHSWWVCRNSWGTDFAPYSPVRPGYLLLPEPYLVDFIWEAALLLPPSSNAAIPSLFAAA